MRKKRNGTDIVNPGTVLPLLPLIANGVATSEIAETVGRTPEAVRSRVRGLLWLLEACNRAHAVSQAYRSGLLENGELTMKARALIDWYPPHEHNYRTL